ncbi:Protein kinase domain - like 10 [Theobroma cacao]|nr:Protein kinase domain - like 10 [Theobroma cacao]
MASPFLMMFSLVFSSFCHGLKEGSSISVEKANDVLTSADGTFSAGFHPVGNNAYCFAIWFNKPSCGTNNCTVVWMANRDLPVNDGSRLWQSFDSPTDTLLPLQPLNKNTKLVSSRSKSNYSSGFFTLYFDTDNVLSLVYESPEVSSVYWPDPWLLSWEAGRSTYNSSRIAALDSLGNFTSTDSVNFMSTDYGSKIQRMLKIDSDGNVRLYSLKEGEETWVVSWQAFSQPCRIHGICGPNSVCSYSPNLGRKCSCIPGYMMKNTTDWSFGCVPEFDLPCNQADQFGFLKLRHVEFYGYDYDLYPNYTIKMCEDLCLSMFSIQYTVRMVYIVILRQLLNGHRSKNFEGDLFLKLPKASLSSFSKTNQDYKLDCSIKFEVLDRKYPTSNQSDSLKLALWSAGAIGVIEIFSIFFVLWILMRTRRNSRSLRGYSLTTASVREFTYADLKKATNDFKEEIGRGGGGIVYKGKLSDGRIAAIKRLIDANHQGEADFLAEANTIGKLHHMNVIEMWGYCTDGKHRLLVYEYMEQGSLAKGLSFKAIDWRKRFEIAVGTAKGLAYLHEECLEWVLHCDIKPQNILIDSSYQPKVSDFGLSWLLNRGDVKYSGSLRIRGTRGYMAPEWVSNLPITSKVDVYSYGIVLLELVTGRNPAMKIHSSTDCEGGEDKGTLVTWVREQMKRATVAETWTGNSEIIDRALDGKYDISEMLILVTIALQCVQEDKDARPTMGQVVEMLIFRESNFAAKALAIAKRLSHGTC